LKYRNLVLTASISSPVHPIWQWLAERSGRIAGLSLELRLEVPDAFYKMGAIAEELHDWMQPLQTLSGIPGVQLRVERVGTVYEMDHPFITQWLKQHGQLISHLTIEVGILERALTLREFCEAAAVCRSIDLAISHCHEDVVDLSELDAVAGSLVSLDCLITSGPVDRLTLRGTSALSSMSQLTALQCDDEDFGSEEPWDLLAMATGLQRLSLAVTATGDPSPLSALTGLTYLAP
jgi:hypothetical protein